MGCESERRCRSALRYPMPGDYGGEQKHNAKNAGACDRNLSGMTLEHPQSHDDRDGDGHPNGEDSPRTIRKRIDHHNAETGEGDQKNKSTAIMATSPAKGLISVRA